MSDFYKKHSDEFKFGWEVELMITDKKFNPLYDKHLLFNDVQNLINSVPVDDIPYLKEKYTGSGLRPYYVEGYDAGYDQDKVRSVSVKGIEIRTPIAFSISDSVALFEEYYEKMQKVMQSSGMNLSCFGNHPFQNAYKGERARRNVIEWASAEVAMTTHGLVINISLPDRLEEKLDRAHLANRFSFASPAMVLLAGNTPFKDGGLWKPEGRQAFSDRSYRRSFVRDTVYYRDDQHHRKEVTLFDMTNDLTLYTAYAALSLGIILSEEELPVIPDRFSKENIRRATLAGYEARFMDRHFDTFSPASAVESVLSVCSTSLSRHGFNEDMLKPLWNLLAKREMPAEQTIRDYQNSGSIQNVLKQRSNLIKPDIEMVGKDRKIA